MQRVHLALGSNLGDRSAAIRGAVADLAALPDVVIRGRSRLRTSQAVGGPSGQPDYLNAAVLLDTVLGPFELLDVVHEVEAAFGRRRDQVSEERWGPRTLDIDIVFYSDLVLSYSRLMLPHPRAVERDFVLRPICDLAPDHIHPLEKRRVSQLLADLSQENSLRAITP